MANEADKCPGCGVYLSESTVPHVVMVDEIVCHRCAALDHHANDQQEKTPGGHKFTYPEPPAEEPPPEGNQLNSD